MTDYGWASVTPRKCRRHLWVPDGGEPSAEPVLSPTGALVGYSVPPDAKYHCARCRKPFSPEVSRRGRSR